MKPTNSEAASAAEPAGVSRRTVLKLAAVGTLGAAVGVGASAGITHWGRTAPPPYRFFSEAEARLLIAICEQIIPRDDTPGATDAGVIYYIDRQISGPLARYQQSYRLGLASFRKTCLQVYKTPFEKLSFEQQTDALRLIEAGQAPKELWGEPVAAGFLRPGARPHPAGLLWQPAPWRQPRLRQLSHARFGLSEPHRPEPPRQRPSHLTHLTPSAHVIPQS